jgi:hypothetical protein
MSTLIKRFAQWILLPGLLLGALALWGGYAIWQEVLAHPGFEIVINGKELGVQELSGLHWASLLLAGGLALVILLLVLPLTLMLGLSLPLLLAAGALGLGLLLLVSVGGLLCSPLLLLGLLLWLALRRRPARSTPTLGTTPPDKPQAAPAAQP